jgi:hypothetical protein
MKIGSVDKKLIHFSQNRQFLPSVQVHLLHSLSMKFEFEQCDTLQ